MEKAYALYSEAVELENQGQLQKAYLRYNVLCEGVGIKPSDIPPGACEGVERLSANIHTAYDHAMAALNKYRSRTGRYPETLEEVRKDIPEPLRTAFSGFRYIRESDSKASIVTGLYGSKVFDLKN